MANEKKNINYKKTIKKLSTNYWAISTVVLAIVLLVIVVIPNESTGAVISSEVAGQKVLEFANNQGANAELISTSDDGSLYEVILSIDGQEIPVYVTKDGKTLVPQPIPLEVDTPSNPTPSTPTPTPTEIPKSDKPVVELFIWSYCPYGVQAQTPMSQVASLLGDSADIRIVPYYDGHGAYETQQNKIQACIQKLDPANYWDYAADFVEKIYPKCGSSKDISCDKTESISLMNSLGINSAAVMTCVDSDGSALLTTAKQNAQANGVTGSPTVLINGVKANVARTADAYKTAICSAFNEVPNGCSATLDSTAATAAGNC